MTGGKGGGGGSYKVAWVTGGDPHRVGDGRRLFVLLHKRRVVPWGLNRSR